MVREKKLGSRASHPRIRHKRRNGKNQVEGQSSDLSKKTHLGVQGESFVRMLKEKGFWKKVVARAA